MNAAVDDLRMSHMITHAITRLKASAFVKNVLIVMSGTTAAQVISFALTPVISRLFTPSDFGVFGSFSAVAHVIAAGVTLEYSQAIMLPKEKENAINLFFVSCLSTLAIGFLCMTACLLAPSYLNGLMKTNGACPLALLVFFVIISGLNESFQSWCVRVKAFKHTSASQVIRSLSSSVAKIGFGLFHIGAIGLIVSNILANIFASINLVRVLIPDVLSLRENIRWSQMKQLAREYYDFPVYSASQNVVNALSSGLPVLLLTHYYGIMVAGAYAFGISILTVPMGFVLTALRQVLFQKAGETHYEKGKLAPLYVKITVGLFAVVFFPTLLLFVWSPEIFTWIFGSQWDMAGEFARYLILWLIFSFCNLPAVLFARIIRMQRIVFLYDLLLLAARASSLVLGGLYLTALQTIIIFSVVGAIMNLFLILLVGHAVAKQEGDVSIESVRDYLMKGQS